MAMLLLIGGFCSVIFKKLKMPAAIGYIVSGILLSNYWSGENAETEEIVEFLSDLGLVLMMFCIGMELNLKKLKKMGSFAMMVVMIQVPIMLIGGFLGGSLIGLNALQSIAFGAIISGSSTAVITIVLAEQDKISHADVETLILVTVIEDVAQVLILSAISPMMTGTELDIAGIVWMLITVIIFMAVAILVGLMFIPRLLDYLGDKSSTEVLLIVSLGLCFALSYLSVFIGMSMAIGAFMMGVIVSQAKHHKKIETDIEPMKDVFMMMFFVSIGMLIRPTDLIHNLPFIVIIYAIYLILKSGSVMLAYFVGNKPLRLSFYCSISLVAMGEFAFIISKEAYAANIISADFYTSVIGAALMSMIVLPLFNRRADKFCDFVQVHTPQPMVNGFLKLEGMRSNFYTKMSQATKETMVNFRTRLANMYATLVIIALVQIVFILITPGVAHFINEHTPDSISLYITTAVIMLVNFVILVPILHKTMKNLKYIIRVFLDSERKALAAGKIRARPKTDKVLRGITHTDDWIFIVLLDFLILMLTPNEIDLWGHVIVAVAGIIIVAVLEIMAYMRRS